MTPDKVIEHMAAEWALEADFYANQFHDRQDNPIDWQIVRDTRFAQIARADKQEQCAKWYETEGWLMDEDDIPAAIRALKD